MGCIAGHDFNIVTLATKRLKIGGLLLIHVYEVEMIEGRHNL